MDFRSISDRQRVAFFPRGESLTKQSFRDECNINNLMRRFEKNGVLEHVNRVQGRYGDFSVVPDYQTALNRVMEAQAMFMSIPARIRAEFGNDAGRFLAFAEDPENELAMRELGLLPALPQAEPAEPASEPPAGGSSAPPGAVKVET